MLSHVGPMFLKAGTHDVSTDATAPLLPLSQGPALLGTQQASEDTFLEMPSIA